jgi:two-component system, chemotaxis family, protein-glutamate methylesterase/glutaminase
MSKNDFYIVGVGASAGGQEALTKFFGAIPSDTNAAFVVVTHLSRDFPSALPEIMKRFTKLPVSRISGPTVPYPGNVYVMPEDVLLRLQNGLLIPSPRPTDNIINHSINIFFESLAEEQMSKAIGVVLSGMGSDGSEGALKIFEHGGEVLVQDPESTRFNSMPMATILKDHPDFILPPAELAKKIVQMVEVKKTTIPQSIPIHKTL